MKTIKTLFSISFILIFSIVFLSLSSCNKNDETLIPYVRTYEDLVNDFKAIDISDGIIDVELRATSTITWSVRIISPGITEGEKYPLVVTLHGAAAGNPNAHKSTACLVEPGLADLGAIIISPNGFLNFWHDGPNQQQVLTLVDLAMEYWPVDTARIAVQGYSNGGNGAWFYAETRPEIFTAAIPMASSYNTYDLDSVGRYIETPLYVIHGENDELFPLEDTQHWVSVTEAVGTNVTFVIADTLSHTQICDYTSYLQDAVIWLQNDVWN